MLVTVRVALFLTCYNDTVFPETGKAVVRLLERLGQDVDFPLEQTCCGQMHINTGSQPEALPLVHRFVRVFRPYQAVVSPSGSCVGSVRHQHEMVARHAGDDRLAEAVRELTPRVYDLSEFLLDLLGVADVGGYCPHRVTYPPTCH